MNIGDYILILLAVSLTLFITIPIMIDNYKILKRMKNRSYCDIFQGGIAVEMTPIKEKQLRMTVSRRYAKPYIQKIKSIVWNQFDSVCEFENNSFDIDEEVEVTLFFLCTEKQYDRLLEIIRNRFQSQIQMEVM